MQKEPGVGDRMTSDEPRIRKLMTIDEEIFEEKGITLNERTRRVTALAVLSNPYVGKRMADLSSLLPFSEELGKKLGKIVVDKLGGIDSVEAYGKAGLVGEDGELEHIEFILHGKLAYGYRQHVGMYDVAKEYLEATEAIGPMGTPLYIPMRFKKEWQVNYVDTVRVVVPDAPRRDEMIIAISGGKGPRPLGRMPPESQIITQTKTPVKT